jgi:predicted enzyme related to lactoylglutathione lyase
MRTAIILVCASLLMGCSESNLQGETSTSADADASKGDTTVGRVTGIGGMFFKSESPSDMRDWYHTHLGLKINEYGSIFEFREGANPEKVGYLQWSPFSDSTKYFDPSKKQFMINYRVKNIEKLVERLASEGVVVTDTIETYEYGKFVHIMDLEGNKLELWEPVDSVFTRLYEGETTR